MATTGFGTGAGQQKILAPTGDALQAMFVKFDGVDGESMDASHTNWIDVLSSRWGVAQASSASFGSGVTTGKANVDEFCFVKYVDKASASLWQKSLEGKSISKVEFHGCRIAGGKIEPYLMVTLENVVVSQIALEGSADSPRLMEEIRCSFTKMKAESKSQNVQGQLQAGGNMTWDIKKNQA